MTGGGGLADHLRTLDQIHHPQTKVMHELAIETMALNARLLASLEPAFESVTRWRDLKKCGRGCFLWIPDARLAADHLPHGWEVTSDSIALSFADFLGSSGMMLVKSVDSVGCLSAQKLAQEGIIDDFFPQLARRSRCSAYIMLRHEWSTLGQAIGDPRSLESRRIYVV